MDVVAVGGCYCDFVSVSPRLPTKGETILGTKFITQHGGKAANIAATAANLSGKSALIARVGNDFWGEDRIRSLNELRVNTDYIQKTPGHQTGIAVINLSERGENQIVDIPGASYELKVEDVEKFRDVIQGSRVVAVTLEIPFEVAKRALELSTEISVLNAAPAHKFSDDSMYNLPSLFIVNESEASVFTELPVNSLNDVEKAAMILLKKGCRNVVVTAGSQGAVFASNFIPKPVHIKCPTVKCVDSTGAGDAFVGVLSYLLASRKGLEMEEMVEAACYCAAYSVTIQGSQASLPSAEVLQKYFSSKR